MKAEFAAAGTITDELRNYVEVLGGQLTVTADFKTERITLATG